MGHAAKKLQKFIDWIQYKYVNESLEMSLLCCWNLRHGKVIVGRRAKLRKIVENEENLSGWQLWFNSFQCALGEFVLEAKAISQWSGIFISIRGVLNYGYFVWIEFGMPQQREPDFPPSNLGPAMGWGVGTRDGDWVGNGDEYCVGDGDGAVGCRAHTLPAIYERIPFHLNPAEKPGKATTAVGNQGANNKDERCQGAGELLFYEIANTIKPNSCTPPTFVFGNVTGFLRFGARKIVVFPSPMPMPIPMPFMPDK